MKRSSAKVGSKSVPGWWWAVTWDDVDGWRCPCLGFAYRHRCSHVAAVREVVELTVRERSDVSDPVHRIG